MTALWTPQACPEWDDRRTPARGPTVRTLAEIDMRDQAQEATIAALRRDKARLQVACAVLTGAVTALGALVVMLAAEAALRTAR